MGATARRLKEDRIQLRAAHHQVLEIDEAANVEAKTRTDFILDAATREARRVLTDRRVFALGDAQRDEFLRLLDRPPVARPRLQALVNRGSVLPASPASPTSKE